VLFGARPRSRRDRSAAGGLQAAAQRCWPRGALRAAQPTARRGAARSGRTRGLRRGPGPGDARELLRAALEVPGGDEFLMEAPLETVAIVFGVRPGPWWRGRARGCRRR
jgi:hypothetical protein